MKLNNTIRANIVSRVMADVPKVDYAEKMRQRAIQLGRDHMPEAVRKLFDNQETRYYVANAPTGFCYIIPQFYTAKRYGARLCA